jgi:hypothetical protein
MQSHHRPGAGRDGCEKLFGSRHRPVPAVAASQWVVGKKDLRHQSIEWAADLHVKVAGALDAAGAIGARHKRVELATAIAIGAPDAVTREASRHGIGMVGAGVRVVTGVIRVPQLDAGTGDGPPLSRLNAHLKLQQLRAVGQ